MPAGSREWKVARLREDNVACFLTHMILPSSSRPSSPPTGCSGTGRASRTSCFWAPAITSTRAGTRSSSRFLSSRLSWTTAAGSGSTGSRTPTKRRVVVALSMALNLGMLGYFKYYNFFAESLQAVLGRAGLPIPLSHLEVVLPIGISFYTFQSMSYVIDVYRREIKPTRNLAQFAVFVSFFPHLVAGPIMRATTLLPQVASRRRFNLQQFYEGVYLIFWGLVEKVVVADNLAIVANDLFGRWETLDGGLALLAIYAFAFQIYGDFSGYTNMARGVAKCLGFELPLNFNLPYFATSPRDFWSRWHISLSQWLRDYLYIPLGGSRARHAPHLSQRDADDDPRRSLAWRDSGPSSSGDCTRGFCWSCTDWPHRGSSGFSRPIRRSRLLDRPANRRHLPSGLSRLVDLPRRFARASRRHAGGDFPPAGDSGRGLSGPRGPDDHPALAGPVRAVRRRRSRRHRPYPVVRPQRLLHGVFLRDRARRPVRGPAVHLFSVLDVNMSSYSSS